MAFNFANLIEPQFAPNTATALFTGPPNTQTRIDHLVVVNTDTVSHTITIYLVPSGSSFGASNLSTQAQVIQPGQTWVSPNEVGHVLAIGDTITVIASVASLLTITASGILQQ